VRVFCARIAQRAQAPDCAIAQKSARSRTRKRARGRRRFSARRFAVIVAHRVGGDAGNGNCFGGFQ